MHTLELVKPDGRRLTLYSRRPLDAGLAAPEPFAAPPETCPHLRWHPLRGEWVAYADYRRERHAEAAAGRDPLAPTADAAQPTELPGGDWDAAVFDNRFPALAAGRPCPSREPVIVPSASAAGHCEVLVFSRDAATPLGALPLAHLELLLQVWAERTRVLGARDGIEYVMPFENRGAEAGATLAHPHGQVYAYPVVPPVPARIQMQMGEYHRANRRGLLQDLIGSESQDGRRLLYVGPHAVAFVPVCARCPYEAWVAPLEPAARLDGLGGPQRADLARALKTVLLAYDGLRPQLPYVLAWYQAPTDGERHPEWHVHAQLFPALATPGGSETGAGFVAMERLPEDMAAELRQVAVALD